MGRSSPSCPRSVEDRVFEITDKPIAAADLEDLVITNADGAVVTFAGVVRGHSKGKKVLYLEYEAYKEMAEKKMAEIGEEIKARWPIDRIAIRHRVGYLEIGETAVAIAVSAPHRQEAFEACQYAIDRLKRFVPVWKKEVWEDGEVWVGREGG
ncbi:MAG: molybdenum cofactor biosynthesis protein MoaE [Chloroflexi bacterium]|nr:molybdenum cofactor biosynthesis protein MoaE [Chloroflexota bacterium]